jgi:hypothetical protein
MPAKQRGAEERSSNRQMRQEGNLGQKEAQLEKEKKSELSRMGERSQEPELNRKHERKQ